MPLSRPRMATVPSVLALAAFSTLLALTPHADAQTVKVGLAMDLSGPFAVGGAESMAGFAVAIKQLAASSAACRSSSSRPTPRATPRPRVRWSSAC